MIQNFKNKKTLKDMFFIRKHEGKLFSLFYVICIVSILLISTGCSQTNVRSHIGTVAGGVSGFTTCRALLDTNVALTAACTLIGAQLGANMMYKNDMNIHNAVFIDTLNTAPGKRSHTNWGNSRTGNWGSVTINRSYVSNNQKCTEYTSVISIENSWPMNSIKRESEWGVACQHPDGRWEIVDTTQKGWW
tara:strand:- start:45 stop:614 length:570 start_codon:yes stop_codon:yes gene_type:complete